MGYRSAPNPFPKSKYDHLKYQYLREDGWNELHQLYDDTKNMTSSGIIALNIPMDISKNSTLMPKDKYWVSIGVSNDVDAYADTVYLNTNGIKLTRVVDPQTPHNSNPAISPGAISKPNTKVTGINKVDQPFASKGGKAPEVKDDMYSRASSRLKTRDRIVTSQDIYVAIDQQFPEVYYSKSFYNRYSYQTEVYVVRNFNDWEVAGAFRPKLNVWNIDSIKKYLNKRTSAFNKIEVSNFNFEKVKVEAYVVPNIGYNGQIITEEINKGLNLYLSPWIKSKQNQVSVDQGISTSELIDFIQSYKSVNKVSSLQLFIEEGDEFIIPVNNQYIRPSTDSSLFISSLDHQIKFRSE